MMLVENESTLSQPVIEEAATMPENSQQDRFMQKLLAAIRQLSEVIDGETQALISHNNIDFNNIKARKARSLHILTQLLDDMGQIPLRDLVTASLEPLRQLNDKLARNEAVLQTHMEAMSELVEMINLAAHAQETDGTYDPYLHAKQFVRGSHSD